MAYKKYIKRNGKIYGPYVYNSKRVGGKVVSEYIGQSKEKRHFPKKKILFVIVPLLVLGLVFLSFPKLNPFTGKVTLGLNTNKLNNTYTGNVSLNLLPGELIPASSTIVINNANKTYSFNVSDFGGLNVSNGTYYAKYVALSGSGEGYGVPGKKIIPTTVFFKLELVPQTVNQSNSTLPTQNTGSSNQTTNQTVNQNQTTTDITNETQTNQTATNNTTSTNVTVNETNSTQQISSSSSNVSINSSSTNSNQSVQNVAQTNSTTPTQSNTTTTQSVGQNSSISNSSGNSTSPITGEVISNNSGVPVPKILLFFRDITGRATQTNSTNSIVQGDVSIGSNYTYKIPSGYTAKIVPGSVSTQTNSLPDNYISTEISGNEFIVKTNYSQYESGFGKNYLGTSQVKYDFNLKSKGINLLPGPVNISILSQGKKLAVFNQNVENTTAKIMNLTNQTFNNSNATNFYDVNLTSQEKAILNSTFGSPIVVKTNASLYRNKIIVEFSLGNLTYYNSYSDNLSDKELKNLILMDKSRWLKDLANNLLSKKPTSTPLTNFSNFYTLS